MVLDGTLQVSWLLAAREGKMVATLAGQLIRMSDSDSDMNLELDFRKGSSPGEGREPP